MYKYCFSAAMVAAAALSAANDPLIGVVNFGSCVTESKTGLHEQENLETLRRQFSSMIESTDKELKEISAKFEDTDYLDSLSPKAEEELRNKQESLQERLMMYQQQFHQMMNQANYQVVYKIRAAAEVASEKVAKEKHLTYVINEDMCFYVQPSLDVTSFVIAEMDKAFELEAEKLKESTDNLDNQ
ncbi:MAG TPA: OmpH family outer membrane protein [Chlamydiales bacterium]|nr:MAG: hypothetical protein A3F67_07675 [Verrucomicrobia bacterium RIFCSPHIGHO2_12_FULL_41_10]HLB52566.1 OmpH family outer membrane protein [Chlamydiales bacterium]